MDNQDVFIFKYIQAKQKGFTGEAAIREANGPGEELGFWPDLYLRSHKLGVQLDAYKTAKGAERALIMKQLSVDVIRLFGKDVCPVHLSWIKARVDQVCLAYRRKSKEKEDLMGGFYENMHKNLLKTGCEECEIRAKCF